MIWSPDPRFWLAIGTDLLIAATVKASRARQGIWRSMCARTGAHEYHWVEGVLTCWICDHAKDSGAPGQPAGGDG